MLFQSVIFDLDGTLLDTIDDLADAGNHVLSVLGFAQHETDAYKEMVGNGVPKLVERFLPSSARGGSIQQMALQMFMNHYAAHSADKTKPYDGIPELLRLLGDEGVTLAVLSNKEHAITLQVIDRYFPGVFHVVAGHVLGTPTKPDPAGALQICTAMGVQPQNVLYVGDSAVDMQTARNAGMTACGVLWGYRSQQELEQSGAHFIATTPKGLSKLVLNRPASY